MYKKYLKVCIFLTTSLIKEESNQLIKTIKLPRRMNQTSLELSNNFSKLFLSCMDFVVDQNGSI